MSEVLTINLPGLPNGSKLLNHMEYGGCRISIYQTPNGERIPYSTNLKTNEHKIIEPNFFDKPEEAFWRAK